MDQAEVIQQFVNRVVRKFKPASIILFGSRAKGDQLAHSDFDFIIISSQFSNMHWLDRISAIVKLWASNEKIDVIPYTPEEFEERKTNSSTIRNAMKDATFLHGKLHSVKQ